MKDRLKTPLPVAVAVVFDTKPGAESLLPPNPELNIPELEDFIIKGAIVFGLIAMESTGTQGGAAEASERMIGGS